MRSHTSYKSRQSSGKREHAFLRSSNYTNDLKKMINLLIGHVMLNDNVDLQDNQADDNF